MSVSFAWRGRREARMDGEASIYQYTDVRDHQSVDDHAELGLQGGEVQIRERHNQRPLRADGELAWICPCAFTDSQCMV